MCNIGTKCVPDWYQIGTRFVLDWYQIGTTMVPDGRQMGARSASDKSLSPLLVHPDTDKAGDIFHCCVHRDLVHLAISASRCYAPVLTKHGAPRPCRRRTGSLVHFLHTSARSAIPFPGSRFAQRTQNATLAEFGSRQVRCGGSAENRQANRDSPR